MLNVWVQPRRRLRSRARAVTHDRDRGVRVLRLLPRRPAPALPAGHGGDESWRLYLLDLLDESPATSAPGDARRRACRRGSSAHNRWHPQTVLVALNDRDPQLHDLHRLDLGTGSSRSSPRTPASWTGSSTATCRCAAASTMTAGRRRHRAARRATAGDEPYLEIPPDDAASTGVLGFTRDGSALIVLSSLDVNATRLERHDLATGERQVVAEDDAYDVAGVWLDPATLEPQAVEFDPRPAGDRAARRVARATRPRTRLRGLGDGDLGVGRRERGDRLLDGLGVAQRRAGALPRLRPRHRRGRRYLFPHRPQLEGVPLAPMEPFSFTARDGLEVHGYLTFPPRRGAPRPARRARSCTAAPGRVTPGATTPRRSGWPTAGTSACRSTSARSTGYGKAFLNAGDKQWGRAMQDDLTDAVEHVVAQGCVDRDRVGIFGGSYGGYAVLAGARSPPTCTAAGSTSSARRTCSPCSPPCRSTGSRCSR